MLISDSHRFIFVHNRKVAGTSVRQYLSPYARRPPMGRVSKLLSRAGLRRDYRHHVFRVHAPLSDAERRMPRGRFRDYFKFAFVRNPWERLVSEYEYILRTPGHGRHEKVSALSGFSAFIDFQIPRRDAYQWPLLIDQSGRMAMDFVGRLEHFDEDFDTVCGRIEVPATRLEKLNRAGPLDYRGYFSPQDVERVARHWSAEIEAFGYRFE